MQRPAGHSDTGSRCGLIRLLMVIVYDAVIMAGLLLVATALVSPFDGGNQRAMVDPVFTVYLVLVWFSYLCICWRKGGMTVGMRAWRVRLVANDAPSPSWRSCIIRFVVAMLSAAALGLGFLWMFFDSDKRSWHDIASGTGLFRTA